MFRRLVQNIRNGFPEYLNHPLEVSEIYQTLIPYRHNRRELEIETNQDYEVALCRLLSGERGYLIVDDALAEAMRQELAAPNPNTAIFREFAASRVALAPNAQRRWQEMGGDLANAPTLATPPTPKRLDGAPSSAAAAPPPPPLPWAERFSAAPRAGAGTAENGAGVDDGACRYCGGSLPTGRRAMFCPHCGQNLTVQRCPACGTELEMSWKFCITCGRGIAGVATS